MSSIDPGRPAKDQYEKGQHEKARALAVPPKIGILHSGAADAYGQQIAALLSGLSDAGYVDGDNVTIQYTWADNDPQQLATNAAALVQVPVDVIVAAGGSIAALAAKAATTTIPVVFTTVTDPVANGLVTSLDDPGGNLTGMAGLTSELDPKRLELLKEFDPTRTKVGVLVNPSRKNFTTEYAALEAAGQNLGLLPLERGNATKPNEIEPAINGFSAAVQSILVTADPLFNTRRRRVINRIKAKAVPVPAIYQWRDFVTGGGLMSYGPSIAEAYKEAGTCVGQILDGDVPRNLPVKFPSSYELVINLKTARSMNFKIPVSMLTRATLVRRTR